VIKAMAGSTTLFLGGARSGKSRIAQAAAEASAGSLVYIATAQAGDDEMADRIAHHRADRGPRWRTIECPLAIGDAIRDAGDAAILVDCLTLWLTNLMLGGHDIEAATSDLLAASEACKATLLLVSNEVGLGLVPQTPLGRAFRDAAGRLNQSVAAAADHVRFVAAGLSMTLK
jgi:adenosylcobinamide kinase/adenosylcobinamide-phosphate guanylyltransferase